MSGRRRPAPRGAEGTPRTTAGEGGRAPSARQRATPPGGPSPSATRPDAPARSSARTAAAPRFEISTRIEDPAWRALPAARLARRAARAALRAGNGRDGEAALSILFASDDTVRALNRDFRGKDAPTNVLSFPAPPLSGSLGDVVLAHGTCAREALADGKTLADHLTHLVVHGVLHLLGRDHDTEADAEAMEAEERRVLLALGVPDPYADPCADPCADPRAEPPAAPLPAGPAGADKRSAA